MATWHHSETHDTWHRSDTHGHVAPFRHTHQVGHHLLLIGNQGVGKNKLTDRMLELLGAEREYFQLHRDTTVAALTQVVISYLITA